MSEGVSKHGGMEIEFQHSKHHLRGGKLKGKNKYVGVRQRASGKWVAEIKGTTQKIRMWLGTYDTAEEAARAYDEAACLLRGSNTRTNFITRVSFDSPLASRIQNLLNNKKRAKTKQQEQDMKTYATRVTTNQHELSLTEETSPSKHNKLKFESLLEMSTISIQPCLKHDDCFQKKNKKNRRVNNTIDSASISSTTNSSNSDTCENSLSSEITTQSTQLFDDAYRPDLSNPSWGFEAVFDRFSFSQVMDVANLADISGLELPEFERMKVERQISASLYAINGVQEYMDIVQDSNDEALWDLSPLCSFLC